jgi:hypothetical protein
MATPRDTVYLGADPDGGRTYTGLMDDIRISARRRYNGREQWPEFNPESAARPIPFGEPLFNGDRRLIHAGFESPTLEVHPEGKPALEWNLNEHAEFTDYQVDTPFGKGLLVDPAMGFPRIPIHNMDPNRGTLELWFQPVNWDDNTSFGLRINWNKQNLSILRFRGRHRRNGEVVTFMEVFIPRGQMGGGVGWSRPGRWNHFVWSWSPTHSSLPHPLSTDTRREHQHGAPRNACMPSASETCSGAPRSASTRIFSTTWSRCIWKSVSATTSR